MIKIKRIISAVCTLCLLFAAALSLFSCADREEDGRISIVCTVFPQYDWLKNIIGDSEGYSLTLLSDNGSDIHSYQPTVADRVRIAECDVLVCVGGESDAWVEEMLDGNEDIRLVRLTEIEGVTLREVSSEGILSEHTHSEHGHEHDNGHEHAHGEYDEHMWLSLRNASVCVEYFGKLLSELTPDKEAAISARTDAYIAELGALDAEYGALCMVKETPRVIVADRFPFAYITADYGIEFCAAFDGCSTESNADLSTVKRLAERAVEWEAAGIVVTESSDMRLANSVIAASGIENARIVVMDSMQSVTRARISAGESYLSLMRENLSALKEALS